MYWSIFIFCISWHRAVCSSVLDLELPSLFQNVGLVFVIHISPALYTCKLLFNLADVNSCCIFISSAWFSAFPNGVWNLSNCSLYFTSCFWIGSCIDFDCTFDISFMLICYMCISKGFIQASISRTFLPAVVGISNSKHSVTVRAFLFSVSCQISVIIWCQLYAKLGSCIQLLVSPSFVLLYHFFCVDFADMSYLPN